MNKTILKFLYVFIFFFIMSIMACSNEYESDNISSVISSDVEIESQTVTEASDEQKIIMHSSSEIDFEELNFIDEFTYLRLSEMLNEIDYMSGFDCGIVDDSDSIDSFYSVIIGEEELVINNEDYTSLLNIFESLNLEDSIYYFFDMDDDGKGELIVKDGSMSYYVLKNDKNKGVTLIKVLSPSVQLQGSNKVSYWNANFGLTFGYKELTFNECEEVDIRFYSGRYLNNVTNKEVDIYLVGFLSESTIKKLVEDNRSTETLEVYVDENVETYYLRITEEEYGELTKDFFEARDISENKVKSVTYTFEELFGSK